MSAHIAPDAIDSDKLLAPISAERPAGEFLRYDGTYDRIREARREDDAALTQGIYKKDLKRADWKLVETICLETLSTRSKDLQIAAWLMEAWLQLYGFAGARDGLQLLTELLEGYWEDLHPQLNEGDPEDRTGTFVWVNEKLSILLRLIPITDPQANDLQPYSFADWESASRLDQLAQRDPNAMTEAEANGQVTLTRFQSSAMLTPASFYVELFDELTDAAAACEALHELLEERFGKRSPGLQRFKDTLSAIRHLVSGMLHVQPEEPALATRDEDAPRADTHEEQHDVRPEVWSTQPIRSRAEAYWRLTEAAEYLLRTEPHSPTPYLVKRAVEWGSMSLFEVFQQIIRNEGEMQEINRLLRLTNKEEGG